MSKAGCCCFLWCTLFLIILTAIPTSASNDLLDHLPPGANIIQFFALAEFDEDPDEEYLILYSLQDRYGVIMLDLIEGRYTQVFHVDLGRGDTKTKGKVRFGDTGYTYRILQVSDLDKDGILEFWTIFQPEGSLPAELRMYKYKNHHYLPVFTSQGQYDLQLMDYDGKLVIHEVDYVGGKSNSPLLEMRSKVWNLRENQLTGGEEHYQFSRRDYLAFARSRQRPRLFGTEKGTDRISLCWGNSLNKLAEIPSGERAIIPLLPGNAHLLEWDSSPALDDDIDEEYVFTYLIPSEESPSKVLLLAALADWDFERCSYRITPLPFKAYGRGRDQEGYLYRSVYILPGENLNHLAFLGNGEELPSLKLSILNNNGLNFQEAAVFNANWHLQLMEIYENWALSYRVITADQDKETGRIRTKIWESFPQGVYEEFGSFYKCDEENLNNKSYKERYYQIEEPVWSKNGYKYLLLKTIHRKINPFANQLPGADFQGQTEDYIYKYLNPFRIHDWYLNDLDRDGKQEALLLIRTDPDLWDWPEYRVGLLRKEDRFYLENIGPLFLTLGEGEPSSGVYVADVSGDGIGEIIFLIRDYDIKEKKRKTRLELFSKHELTWEKMHDIDLIYDDLRLFEINGEVWLYGFAGGGQNKEEGSVYSFIWKNGRFNYRQKKIVTNFADFLKTLPGKKIDYLSEECRIFPSSN
jgi:hypothetical protein